MALKWYGDKVAAEIRGRADAAVIEAAEFLADTARSQAPVKTGELRDSIEAIPGPALGTALVVATAPHAEFVEFGTSRMPANPFFRRSMAMCADAIRRILARRLSGGGGQ